jgi:hypothetical protein
MDKKKKKKKEVYDRIGWILGSRRRGKRRNERKQI